jgi:hypothetical protein
MIHSEPSVFDREICMSFTVHGFSQNRIISCRCEPTVRGMLNRKCAPRKTRIPHSNAGTTANSWGAESIRKTREKKRRKGTYAFHWLNNCIGFPVVVTPGALLTVQSLLSNQQSIHVLMPYSPLCGPYTLVPAKEVVSKRALNTKQPLVSQ